MEQATPIPKDLIPAIALYLDLSSASRLLRTCRTYNDIYSKGIPQCAAKKLLEEHAEIRKNDLNPLLNMQFGINRFLQHNPIVCRQLNSNEHLNALVYYSHKNNETMFAHIIKHENSDNRQKRIEHLEFFGYIEKNRTVTILKNIFNLKRNKHAYQGLVYRCRTLNNENIIRLTMMNKLYSIKILLKNGVPINWPSVKYNKKSALFVASRCGYFDLAQFLISNHANIHQLNDFSESALHGAIADGHIEIVDLLLKNGADIHQIYPDFQYSLLHYAVAFGHLPIVQLLISYNVVINSKNIEGQTPLDLAHKKGHREIAAFLQNFVELPTEPKPIVETSETCIVS
jgi:ankyrin repeat protein